MFVRLKKLQEKAYVPISSFRVSAILIDDQNNLYEGVNIENFSMKDGLCAEQVAFATALTENKNLKLKELHVLTDSKTFASPCFLCRQLITEYMEEDAQIILYDQNQNTRVYQKYELCPHPFDSEDLR